MKVEARGQNLKDALPPRTKLGHRMLEKYKSCLILNLKIAMWEGKMLHSKLLQATNVKDMITS